MERTTPTRCTLIVREAEDDLARADVVLGRRVPGLSRRVARRLGLEGQVSCNGRSITPSTRVRVGDRLEFPAMTPGDDTETLGNLEVLRVTDDYVFVSKPRGLHTHRLRPSDPLALADAVARHYPECQSASPDVREGGALHRLDRPTTGVVGFARTPAAWARGRDALNHRARKLYVAIVDANASGGPLGVSSAADVPRPDLAVLAGRTADRVPFWIDAPLRTRGDRVRVAADGQPARTCVWPLGPCTAGELVLLALHGGRRHQLRAHLAHVGWPILGDTDYGSSSSWGPLMLHAAHLDLDPGRIPAVEAPWPPPWPDLVADLRDR